MNSVGDVMTYGGWGFGGYGQRNVAKPEHVENLGLANIGSTERNGAESRLVANQNSMENRISQEHFSLHLANKIDHFGVKNIELALQTQKQNVELQLGFERSFNALSGGQAAIMAKIADLDSARVKDQLTATVNELNLLKIKMSCFTCPEPTTGKGC